MSYLELYTCKSPVFSGFQRDLREADYVILGVPFDLTSTYRTGSRFAPQAIREASLNIETYSFRSGVDLEESKLHDAGDLQVSGDVEETLKRLELVTREIFQAEKIPILIGGEHTVTLGPVKSFEGDVAVVSFDAHLDLRNEYADRSISHATFMRRISEEAKVKRIVEVGTRAICREEMDHAKSSGTQFITSQQIMRNDGGEVPKKIRSLVEDQENVYLSIDMDVLDPAFAPGVQNPEPDGLSINALLDVLTEICNSRIIGFDVTEVTPHYDTGITAIQTAKVIFEVICSLERAKKP